MALKKMTKKAEQAEQAEQNEDKIIYDCKVIAAHQMNDTAASFDLTVNGVTIYGMIYREYTNKEGKEGVMISFPSRKGTGNFSDKWFSHAFFPISKELKDQISNEVIHILNEV